VTNRTTWSALFGLAGLIVSAYLTATHYLAGEVPLACATGGIVNCEQVTTSAQSMLGPVPVAVLGVVWFGVWLGLLGARRELSHTGLVAARLAWATAGLLSVFYLVYAELFLIGAICSWCTVIHAAIIALFLLAVADAGDLPGDDRSAARPSRRPGRSPAPRRG
jgi:uncharacterized membrane protein